MTGGSSGQVCLPPELPSYLKSVHDLKPIIGVASDDEVLGIHAVIRMAQKAVDIPGTGDPKLIVRLSEHLFEVQMSRYRNRHLNTVFPEDAVYAPPTLPAHVAVHLDPITGAPSEEEVAKVQSAMRSYHRFTDIPSMFDPRVDMELSQHLFDIQMARYTQRARECLPRSERRESSNSSATGNPQGTAAEEPDMTTNDPGSGVNIGESHGPTQTAPDVGIQAAIERSNRLAEQTNQLIEHLTQHLEGSNRLAKESTKPVEKLGDALNNINRVLVKIQHAIVRSHRGNTLSALECLTNEKGETPAISDTTLERTYENMATGDTTQFSVVIGGVPQNTYFRDEWLGRFLQFYGIGAGLYSDDSDELIAGKTREARTRLREYLSSCLG